MKFLKYGLRICMMSVLSMALFFHISISYAAEDCGFGPAYDCIDATEEVNISSDEPKEDKLLNVVRSVVNWALGLLGLVALIILIWGGFQMLTAAGDETKYANGRKYLKSALIGIAIIALAALFLNLVFYVVQSLTSTAGPADTFG